MSGIHLLTRGYIDTCPDVPSDGADEKVSLKIHAHIPTLKTKTRASIQAIRPTIKPKKP
jgi:hypothetical protein